jgi:hypothetical protein
MAAVSVMAGLAVYLGHAPGVSGSRALEGAAFATAGVALPLGVYYWLAYSVRRNWLLAVLCVLSLVPITIYFYVLLFGVAALANCPPHAYECPV